MENDRTDTIPQSAVDTSCNFVTEQLRLLAEELKIPLGLLCDIANYEEIPFDPYNKIYENVLSQIPQDLREYVLKEIQRIETEALIIMVSQIA